MSSVTFQALERGVSLKIPDVVCFQVANLVKLLLSRISGSLDGVEKGQP